MHATVKAATGSLKKSPNPKPITQVRRKNRNASKAVETWLGPGLFVRKLGKAYGGYRSLVKTMLINGYSKERVKEMLSLTEAEFVDFQKD